MDVRDLCMFRSINGNGGSSTGIDDNGVSATSTWSSLKISQEMKRNYTSPTKVGNHLYEITYGTWNEEEALAYFEEKYPPFNGGCTAVRKGNKVGRNFDRHYDDIAEFIINCKAHDNVHASVGVVGNVTSITDEEAASGIWKNEYAILPYYTVDGINDAGVFIEANVVDSNDNGHTTGTNTESDHDLIAPMVIRYVLDNANSAEHAVQLLQACNIRTTTDQQEFHWMIADKTDNYEVEIINNELKVVELENPVVTNFFMYGWDGTAATATYNTTEWDPETTTLNEHAVGVARWDTANDGKEDSTMTIEDVMKSVKYSQYYEVDNAYDEFNGIYPDGLDLNITSESSDYADVIAAAQEAYERGERDGSIWITCHTSVYDLDANTLKVVSQEEYDEEWIERDVPISGGGVTDVQVNGTSVVSDGVANIPYSDYTNGTAGVVKTATTNGMTCNGQNGFIAPYNSNSWITSRSYSGIIKNDNFDFAVKAAMTDGVGAAWTDAEKQAARERIGISGGGGASYTIRSVTIPASSWSGQSVTVSVEGVTTSNLVQIAPVSQADSDIWFLCGIFCATQTSGALTFTCNSTPTTAIVLKVIVWS